MSMAISRHLKKVSGSMEEYPDTVIGSRRTAILEQGVTNVAMVRFNDNRGFLGGWERVK